MKSVDGWEEVRKLARLVGDCTGKKQYEIMQEAIYLYIEHLDEDTRNRIKLFLNDIIKL